METTSINTSVRHTSLATRITAFLFAPLVALLNTNATKNVSAGRKAAISESIVIDLIISFLLVAILFPIAQAQIVSATTTLWNSSVITMFAVLLPILVIIAIVYHFLKG